ncbi:hypothetical protein GCM10009731_05910 [Streptomyces globosus]
MSDLERWTSGTADCGCRTAYYPNSSRVGLETGLRMSSLSGTRIAGSSTSSSRHSIAPDQTRSGALLDVDQASTYATIVMVLKAVT